MEDLNKLNALYFENATMRGLFDTIESWQVVNRKRLLSLNIQKDGDNFCCIALTNPDEVVIVSTDQLTGQVISRANVFNGNLLVATL
jgi:hypothetical protein